MCRGLAPEDLAALSCQVKSQALLNPAPGHIWLPYTLLALQCRRLRLLIRDCPVWEKECKDR